MITLLTKERCHLCDLAKEVLLNLGRDYKFQVDVVSTESTEGALLALRKGIVFPPGLLLNGELFAHGRLSEGKLRGELERLQGAATATPRGQP